MIRRRLLICIVTPVLLVGLPLLGVTLIGEPVRKYTEFPPLTRYVAHPGFSLPIFIALIVVITITVLPFDIRAARTRRNLARDARGTSRFPWWGWLGIAGGLTTWILAWTRFEWFKPFQIYSFTPLWLSYILTVNALTYRRSNRCMMTDNISRFLLLFPVSAGFWWFFEYLNRFVQNWYYLGGENLTALKYFILATLPFSTVLPAVLGTYDLLKTIPSCGTGLDNFARINVKHPRITACLVLCLASAGLAGIGIYPQYLFPLLWVSPLLIITALQALEGEQTIFHAVQYGKWREIYLLAAASLICGFFWEMWNYYSLAKWIYSIPFVHRFELFEMPVLGYSGYLPFGLECAVIARLFLSNQNLKRNTDLLMSDEADDTESKETR